jgi:hypothetical protein
MRARRVSSKITELEGQPRAIPVLIYDCTQLIPNPSELPGTPVADAFPNAD